jgi:hypothetical protein
MMSVNQFFKPLPDIGLFAKMRSGKDEVYKMIESMGFITKRVAFGDVMKENFFRTFPHIPAEPKPTAQLIEYGQAMRNIDPNVWVRPTMNRIRHHNDIRAQAGLDMPAHIFTDIRQPNEYEAVKNSGAVMVKIVRPEWMRVETMLELGEEVSTDVLNAPTERHLDNFGYDYIIYNDGTIKDLERQVTELVYQIQKDKLDKQQIAFQNQMKRGTYK